MLQNHKLVKVYPLKKIEKKLTVTKIDTGALAPVLTFFQLP